jgi:hypothetical protein
MGMQSPAAAVSSPKMALAQEAPPLMAGDHLSRAEFERRYAAYPNIKKAELIDGVAFMLPDIRHSHWPDAGCPRRCAPAVHGSTRRGR